MRYFWAWIYAFEMLNECRPQVVPSYQYSFFLTLQTYLTMVLNFSPLLSSSCCPRTNLTVFQKPNKIQIVRSEKLNISEHAVSKCFLPLAASLTLLLVSHPAKAGVLSGSSGIESVPGPNLPQIEFLNRFNEENQKRYADNDARFRESPLLKQYLERSKLNKEKNWQKIQDKYCIRGAEWGVGDCSAEGMTPDEKDSFIAMLKKKAEANAAE